MDGDCSPFSRTNTTGKESVFWDQMTTFDVAVESQYSNAVIYIKSSFSQIINLLLSTKHKFETV